MKWRALWPADGHLTSGLFSFAVGDRTPPQGTAGSPSATGRWLVRWAALASALLLTGTQLFAFWVSPRTAPGELVSLRLVALLAGLALLAATAAELGLAAVALLDSPLRVLPALAAFLGGTKAGWGILLRASTALVVLVLTRRARAVSWAGLVSSGILLWGFTVNSHASGRGFLPALADWGHLLGASGLVGGWVCFLLALTRTSPPQRVDLARRLLPRLSSLLGASLLAVVATGAYGVALGVPNVRVFADTPYGRWLFAKLLLACPILVLGWFNHRVLRPRTLNHSPESPAAVRWLLRAVTGEVSFALLVLFTVAVLADTPPPLARSAPPPASESLVLAGPAGEFRVRFAITPAAPGRNRFHVAVSGPGARPPGPGTRVLLWLTKLDEDLDPQRVVLAYQQPGDYAAEADHLSLPGWWQVEVVVRQPGLPDRSTLFPLPLGEWPLRPSDPKAVRFLEEAGQATRRFRAWRWVEQIADGMGDFVLARYEVNRPDQLRSRTSLGTEEIFIGRRRYYRAVRGPWQQQTLPEPVVASHPLERYLQAADGVVFGRTLPCEEERCRVILWEAASARFAAWVGEQSRRLYRLFMVAPQHYMTLYSPAPARRLQIAPPP